MSFKFLSLMILTLSLSLISCSSYSGTGLKRTPDAHNTDRIR